MHLTMKPRNTRHAFRAGLTFVREHPQVWFTAVFGLMIVGAFVFTAYRFSSIANDAQEALFNDRAGWMLDSFVLSAANVLDDPDTVRTHMRALMELNQPLESMMLIAPHSNDAWRVYVSAGGSQEGTVVQFDAATDRSAREAWIDPKNSYTTITGSANDRRFHTMRAITNKGGESVALAVTVLQLTEADRLIQSSITNSYALLGVILVVLMIVFVRHARIVDYMTLYKKQLEVDEMKDSFISMASHELKSPLTVIRGYIEILKEGGTDVTAYHEYLRRIDVSAEELRLLIDDILDVSRIEMGRLRFSADYVMTAEILSEVAEMFTTQAAQKGLTLDVRIAEGSAGAVVRVDRARVKQVLVNLVSNAVKYTLTGTVTLEQKHVGDRLDVSVHDTGVGMTAQEQHNLFGKFYRAEAEETKGVPGTGLGLWITKYLIEHMGGTISVESIKGEGSRFVVSFPLVDRPSGTMPTDADAGGSDSAVVG
jgi:signal transduction histidine kinase